MRSLPFTLLFLPLAAFAQERARLLEIRAGGDASSSSIELVGDRPLSFTTLKLAAPPRVVVDLADTDIAPEAHETAVDDGAVISVAAAAAGRRTARVVIELAADAEFDVRAHGASIEVRIPKPAPLVAANEPPPAPASVPPPPPAQVGSPVKPNPAAEKRRAAEARAAAQREAAAKAAAAKKAAREQRLAAEQKAAAERNARRIAAAEKAAADRRLAAERAAQKAQTAKQKPAPQRKVAMVQRHAITGIGFRPVQGGEVIVRSDNPLEYGVTGDGNAVLLHLPSAGIPLANNRRPLDTHFFGGPVQRVVPLAKGDGTDVRIELKGRADYQLAQSGTVLTVTFSSSR